MDSCRIAGSRPVIHEKRRDNRQFVSQKEETQEEKCQSTSNPAFSKCIGVLSTETFLSHLAPCEGCKDAAYAKEGEDRKCYFHALKKCGIVLRC